VTFFVLRSDDVPTGLGKLLINYLAQYSVQDNIKVLSLETGIHQYASIGLYERMAFKRIAPFGNYEAHPLSVFFEKLLF